MSHTNAKVAILSGHQATIMSRLALLEHELDDARRRDSVLRSLARKYGIPQSEIDAAYDRRP
ncbi:MAG: hypothetical protein AB7G11_02590 [Phycisphaerales bacterium]